MRRGRVAGTVVASAKREEMVGIPFLLVRIIEDDEEKELLIAADATRQAGYGDAIYLMGSMEAARVFRKEKIPVDLAIVGFIDP